ncbi:hypothetical protein LWC35_35250 [Pseudonocardia kujensis]|uniref:hypothetical protein n=1 Tax=Pseudonocardia kujensis TaxID=1128675 RepID=UPI001E2ACC6A|nr:hypothetical protein [Pseudonocardia kujensis]MCE0768114.1 hypothetical protein [Pseudonocardia kujensis]
MQPSPQKGEIIMGYGPKAIAEMREYAERERRSNLVYAKRLESLGLDSATVSTMSMAQLNESLSVIDATIDSYRKGIQDELDIRRGGDPRTREDSVLAEKLKFSNGFLRYLLAVKEDILERRQVLQAAAHADQLDKIATDVPESPAKDELEAAIASLREENSDLARKLAEIEQAREEVAKVAAMTDIDRYERKAKVWRSFLERESVASILGSIILAGLTITMIIAMFIDRPVPELLSNTFLVVIGYFFGQAASKSSSSD